MLKFFAILFALMFIGILAADGIKAWLASVPENINNRFDDRG